jgi:hypothetical protein
MLSIGTEERRRRLGVRHHLANRAGDIVSVAGDLVGVHSSDPSTVFLSFRARRAGFAHADLEKALYEDRALVRVLGMRRTLFVVPAEMEALLRVGFATPYAPSERRRLEGWLADQHGLGPEWLDDVLTRTHAALMDLGEASARELTEHVPELSTKLVFGAGKKWGGEVGLSTRVLFLLAASGRIVRVRPLGTWVSGQYRWAPLDTWLDRDSPDLDLRDARAEAVKRWLGTYGPGTFEDIKWWAGMGVRDTRAALTDAGAIEVQLDGTTGYVLPGDAAMSEPPEPWVALLPGLDSTPMGWKERRWFLGEHGNLVFDRNGNIGPTIWVNGRIAGGWGQNRDGGVEYEVLEQLEADEKSLVELEVDRLEAWFAGDIVIPRFRTPLENRLSGRSG